LESTPTPDGSGCYTRLGLACERRVAENRSSIDAHAGDLRQQTSGREFTRDVVDVVDAAEVQFTVVRVRKRAVRGLCNVHTIEHSNSRFESIRYANRFQSIRFVKK